MRLAGATRREAEALIAHRLGFRVPERRLADLEQRLGEVLASASVPPEHALTWLAALPDESPAWGHLVSRFTVGETSFFRDRACFEALGQQVLPGLIARRRADGVRRLRIWSAGCATGEEAYSLAMCLDGLLPDRADWMLTILATDVNPEALQAAIRGRFREWCLRDTPASIRDRYFRVRRQAEAFEVIPEIRQMVTFAPLNLATDAYPSLVTDTGAMDLVVCRNVLMYFTPEAQRAAAARLERALVPGAWLVVSPTEASAELFAPLVAVNFPGAIFFRKRTEPLAAPVAASIPEPESRRPRDRPAAVAAPGRPDGATRPPPPTPPSPVELLREARELADRGWLDEARRSCEDAIARDRLDPEAHLLLAAICQEQGAMGAALEALGCAIYLAPDCAPAHFMRGSVLIRQGAVTRGRRALETVVRLLEAMPAETVLPGGDGLTAGRLLASARASLEARR